MEDVDHQLYMAVSAKDFKRVRDLLQLGADVNYKSKKGMTPLHAACYTGDVQIVTYLLENDAEINATKCDKSTPLFVAVHNGKMEVCRQLLDYGADVNHRSKIGETALHLACQTGRLQVVLLLVNAGAEINVTDSVCQTPLHKAVAFDGSDNLKIVSYLVEHNADLDVTDYKGRTPLDIAKEHKYADIVDFLLGHPERPQLEDHPDHENMEIPMESLRIKILPNKRPKMQDKDDHIQRIVSQLGSATNPSSAASSFVNVNDLAASTNVFASSSLFKTVPNKVPKIGIDGKMPTVTVSDQKRIVTDTEKPTISLANRTKSIYSDIPASARVKVTPFGQQNVTVRKEFPIEEPNEDMDLGEDAPADPTNYDVLVWNSEIEEMEAKKELLKADILRAIRIKQDLERRMKTVQKLRDMRAKDSEWVKWNEKLLEMSQQIEDQTRKETELKREVANVEDKITEMKLERENNFSYFD